MQDLPCLCLQSGLQYGNSVVGSNIAMCEKEAKLKYHSQVQVSELFYIVKLLQPIFFVAISLLVPTLQVSMFLTKMKPMPIHMQVL
jgi:hypothetical protein